MENQDPTGDSYFRLVVYSPSYTEYRAPTGAPDPQMPRSHVDPEPPNTDESKPTTQTKSKSAEKVKIDDAEHEVWSNQVQFILTAVGLAVGLGNVWKFPYLAYKHGGAAFLIPYIFFGVTFGLPVLYIEFFIGQYSRANPAKAFYRYAPAFHGVGHLTVILDFLIGCFYALVIAWTELFLVHILMGQSWKWTACGNPWNTDNCIATESHNYCREKDPALPYSTGKGNCTSVAPGPNIQNGAQEFFGNYIMVPSAAIGQFGSANWPVIGCVIFFYILCALTMWKGIRILEKTSYVTVPLPYIVILIFFFRAIFLDGSWDGIKLYLFEPDFSVLASHEPWKDALTQVCFSLTIGCGALISLASHNKVSNNCFRDAVIVTVCDTLMSIIGGVAVFGTLGYLAKRSGRKTTEVVAAGPDLVFISYPEAISTMPVPWLWNALFFLMLFMLGFSSMVAIIEAMTNFAVTSFSLETSKKWKIIIPCIFCTVLATIGSLLATGMGSYWFVIMAGFVATTAPCAAVLFEVILIAYVYRWGNMHDDMIEMWGVPPEGICARLWSRFSPYFKWTWLTITPAVAIAGAVATLRRDKVPIEIPGGRAPIWAEVIGWLLNVAPIFVVPIVFVVNIFIFRKKEIPFKYLFMPSKGMPSHDRYYRKKGIPPPGEWAKDDNSLSHPTNTADAAPPDTN